MSQAFTTNIPARLDRLPWSRFHWLVVAALGITWILDGLEVTLVGSLSPAISQGLGLTTTQIGLTGSAASGFLQGLVSNDLRVLERGPGIVWAALLTPQGKYLADFFVVNTGEVLLLDLPEGLADTTLRRLSMYRLRADVQMAPAALAVTRGTGTPPEGAPAVAVAPHATAQESPWDYARDYLQGLAPRS